MDAAKDQHAALPAKVSKLRYPLRYPLRSAAKLRDEKPAAADASGTGSSAKRGRVLPSASKSMNVLNTSGKDKTVKPPRRLSVPSKLPTTSPKSATVKSISPVSEFRIKKPDSQGKVGTPADASKSTSRRKFNVLSSASYWLTQIKLSESTSKHSLSLGFFKLALESGCEPLQAVCEELKSYALRHKILELGEPARELLRSYNILEELEKLQTSQSCSDVPGQQELRSRSADAPGASYPTRKHIAPKELLSAKNGASKSHTAQKPVKGSNDSADKKLRKSSNLASKKEKGKGKATAEKSASEIAQPPTEETPHADKENMDGKPVEEVDLAVEAEKS